MKAMILAAGMGTRMGKISECVPKPLTIIKEGTTLIEHNIYRLKNAGITDIVINVHWLGNKIIKHLGYGKNYGVKINYSFEKKLLGTGGGVNAALRFLGDKPFWLINADLYSNYKIRPNFKLNPNILCHLVLVTNPLHNINGEFNFFNSLVKHDYKKTSKNYTFSGISLLSPKLFYNRINEKFSLEPILKKAARDGKASGELFFGVWEDVGTKQRLNKILEKSLYFQ